MRNSTPKLLTALRLTLGDIAAWTKKSVPMISIWQAGRYQPRADDRIDRSERDAGVSDTSECARDGRKPSEDDRARF